MNLLNNVYRRWNVTRRKLTLGHQSRKWYITLRFCALEYLTDCVFISTVVAGVGVLDGLLYVIGGEDDQVVHRSVERFDPATKMWSRVAEMSICRTCAGILLFRPKYFFLFLNCFLYQKVSRRTEGYSTLSHRFELGGSLRPDNQQLVDAFKFHGYWAQLCRSSCHRPAFLKINRIDRILCLNTFLVMYLWCSF